MKSSGESLTTGCAIVMMASKNVIAEIGPEFGSEIHEAIVGYINREMGEDGVVCTAGSGIVEIRQSRAQGAAEGIIKIERVASGVFAD